MAGLVGKPDGVKCKRGAKPRWGMLQVMLLIHQSITNRAVVEIDLRQPSMQHGKKGFDRIVYAFENVLKFPVTWLFSNLESKSASCLHFYSYFNPSSSDET